MSNISSLLSSYDSITNQIIAIRDDSIAGNIDTQTMRVRSRPLMTRLCEVGVKIGDLLDIGEQFSIVTRL